MQREIKINEIGILKETTYVVFLVFSAVYCCTYLGYELVLIIPRVQFCMLMLILIL